MQCLLLVLCALCIMAILDLRVMTMYWPFRATMAMFMRVSMIWLDMVYVESPVLKLVP